MDIKATESFKTIITISVALLIVSIIFDLDILVIVAVCLLLLSLLSQFITTKIAWLWLKFAEVLGNITSKVILSAVFFFFLTPIALLYRLFNKDPLNLKNNKNTYYKSRNYTYSSKDFEKTW